MDKFIYEKEIFPDTCYGFIKKRSAINCGNHQISTMKGKVKERLQQWVFFGRFSKINLENLQKNLIEINISPEYVNWVIQCYQNKKFHVETRNGTKEKYIKDRIPQ